jgi:hypothetical protein
LNLKVTASLRHDRYLHLRHLSSPRVFARFAHKQPETPRV